MTLSQLSCLVRGAIIRHPGFGDYEVIEIYEGDYSPCGCVGVKLKSITNEIEFCTVLRCGHKDDWRIANQKLPDIIISYDGYA